MIKSRADLKQAVSASKPDVAMVLWALKKVKPLMSPEEHVEYGFLLEKNIKQMEKFIEGTK